MRKINRKIDGIADIAAHLNVSEMCCQDARIAYDLPIRKENGIFVAFTKDLDSWREAHPWWREEQPQKHDSVGYRVSRGRFGLSKIEKINFRRSI